MNLPFTKMHGLGNDFVIIEEDQLPPDIAIEALALAICDRHFGVGADGLIVVALPNDPSCDIQFKFYNPDGSQAEMCGNGIRCFARYVKDQGIIARSDFRVESLAGVMIPHINADQTVRVDMGTPFLEASTIPFKGEGSQLIDTPLTIAPDQTIPVTPVGMGNPHCIIFQHDLSAKLDPAEWGPKIEVNPAFPAKTNVEFVERLNEHTLSVIVWERGAAMTLACGTGACASAVAGIQKGLVKSPVTVKLPGGDLIIEWNGSPADHVMMTGPATYVFAGTIAYQPQAVATH